MKENAHGCVFICLAFLSASFMSCRTVSPTSNSKSKPAPAAEERDVDDSISIDDLEALIAGSGVRSVNELLTVFLDSARTGSQAQEAASELPFADFLKDPLFKVAATPHGKTSAKDAADKLKAAIVLSAKKSSLHLWLASKESHPHYNDIFVAENTGPQKGLWILSFGRSLSAYDLISADDPLATDSKGANCASCHGNVMETLSKDELLAAPHQERQKACAFLGTGAEDLDAQGYERVATLKEKLQSKYCH